MNRDYVVGAWKEFRGRLMQRWAAVRGDALAVLDGSRVELQGRLQRRRARIERQPARNLPPWDA